MIIRRIWIAVMLTLVAMTTFAQSFSPKVQPSQGGSVTGAGLQLQFTTGEPLISTFTAGGHEFSLGFEQPELNIDKVIVNGPLCAGSQIKVPFSVSGIYTGNNVFTLQLSDSSGSFASPLVVGTDTATHSDTITATISLTVTGGSHYRARVVASGPGFLGGVSEAFAINMTPTVTVTSNSPVCSYNNIHLNSTTGETYVWSGPNSFSSSLQNPTLLASNNGGNYRITVTDANGCSGTTSTNVTVPNLLSPLEPLPQFVSGNISQTFSFGSVSGQGTSANQIEWSTEMDFSTSEISSSPSNISLSVNPGYAQVIWIRSKDSVSGCASNAVTTLARVNPLSGQSETVVSDSSNYLRCGSNLMKQAIYQSDTAYYDSVMALDNTIIQSIASGAIIDTSHEFVIPVVVHIIAPNGTAVGTGSNISYAQIQSQINKLNASFAASYHSYNGQTNDASAVNTHIWFALAQNTSPSTLSWTNSAEPGVMRYYTSDTFALNTKADSLAACSHLTNLTHPDTLHFTFNKYLNIWVVPQIQSAVASKNILGFATYPYKQGVTPPIDGIVMMAQAFGDNSVPNNNYNLIKGAERGNVAVQQAAHYLGLYHAFEPNDPYMGISGFCEGSGDNNCNVSGDFCCDTKKCAPEFTSGSANNSCTGSNDYPVANFMNYLDDKSESAFTFDQAFRMNNILTTTTSSRQNLWTSTNLTLTGASAQNCILSAEIDYGYNGAAPGAPNPLYFRTPNNCATS